MSPPRRKVPKKKGARKRPVNTGPLSDDELAKILGHPIRACALRILNERVASVKMIARELREEQGRVAYHVRVLEENGCLELVREVPKRGATEYLYRATTRAFLSDETWAKLSATDKHGISVAGLKMITGEATNAFMAGLFDSRPNRHLSCTPVYLDEQGFNDTMDALNQALERVLMIRGESASRLAKGSAKSLRATISIMGFESPQPTTA